MSFERFPFIIYNYHFLAFVPVTHPFGSVQFLQFVPINFENNPLDETKWKNYSPNVFHDASGWGTGGSAFEVKNESLNIIKNVFYDNCTTPGALYPVIRYGCCGGGTRSAMTRMTSRC